MTDIVETVEDAFTRVEAHIKNLFENGSPHQKPMAEDLRTVLDAAKAGGGVTSAPSEMVPQAEYNDVIAKLNLMDGNLKAEMEKTDTANAMVKSLQGQLTDAETTIAERDTTIATAEGTIATLTAELATAKAPAASEDAAQKS